jgi:sulfoxide reductase heme-binding subunit YedZ
LSALANTKIVFLKIVIWLASLAPLARLAYRGAAGRLTANPIEFITLSTGAWALIFLLATLAMTPLRRITGVAWLIRFRRLTGMFAFFYACLHFLAYIWLDKFFDVAEIFKDVARRPFIAAGFMAFLLLIPLAATSTSAAIRAIGGKRWQLLHRLIYPSAVAAVLHFWWKVKADTRVPLIYAAVLGVLLAYRIAGWVLSKYQKRK